MPRIEKKNNYTDALDLSNAIYLHPAFRSFLFDSD